MLNGEGNRICARYCNVSVSAAAGQKSKLSTDLALQRTLELGLFRKMQVMTEVPAEASVEDIFEFDGSYLVVFKPVDDVFVFVVSEINENEIIISDTLGTFCGALDLLLRGQVYEENILNNLKAVLLCLDELVDQEGIILESDSQELASRVGQQSYFTDAIPMGEQTLTQALQTARDQITRSILS